MFIYGYADLCKDINRIRGCAEVFSIGHSLCGRDIPVVKFGNGRKKVFINGAHHGAESITSALLMRFALNYAELRGGNTVFIAPMVNPDGAELVKSGCEAFFNKKFLIKANGGSEDFTRWQANARGVDLNHNYDAGWAKASELQKKYGADRPCPSRFGGFAPHSEPETRAMVSFTREERFDMAICYHTQGKEIYYTYDDFRPDGSLGLARAFSMLSGYALSRPSGIASYGGYKDWFIKEIQKPGFTIEAGLGTNPLPFEQLDEIYNDNEELLKLAAFR